jgi:hypothetical protein
MELGNLNYRAVRLLPATKYYQFALSKRGAARVGDSVRANAANVRSLLGEHERALDELSSLVSHHPNTPEYRLDLASAQIQAFQFGAAKLTLVPLVAGGEASPRARDLVARAARLATEEPFFRIARSETLPDLLLRARFSGQAGDRADALPAWRRIVDSPDASAADVREALLYFVAGGDLEDVPPAAARLTLLGGQVEPAVARAFELRVELWGSLESADAAATGSG